MKRLFVLAAAAAAFCIQAYADVDQTDSTTTGIRNYQDEIGYFQIANRDMGDPRFMFHDDKGKLDLGIGGTAKVSLMDGFGGQIPDISFNPFLTVIPQSNASLFAWKISSSEIHVKARSYFRDHKIIAYVKLGGNADNTVALKEAYMSFDGFSVGMIPSFFMDREVGAMTTGTAENSRIDMTHPLIGYTRAFSDKLMAGLALEKPWVDLDYYQEEQSIVTYYQDLPDIAMYGKYRFDGGHLQLGAVLRHMCYWTGVPGKTIRESEGKYGRELGFGGSFSGSAELFERAKLTWQFVGGRGIASYIPDLCNIHVELGYGEYSEKEGRKMGAIPVSAAMLSFTYNWTDCLASSIVLNHSHIFQRQEFTNHDSSSDGLTALANLFWYINDYTYIGGEYLFGYRKMYDMGQPEIGNSGSAHRIAAVMAFCF